MCVHHVSICMCLGPLSSYSSLSLSLSLSLSSSPLLRFGPIFLFEDPISVQTVSYMYKLGPSYFGSFQAPVLGDTSVSVCVCVGGGGGCMRACMCVCARVHVHVGARVRTCIVHIHVHVYMLVLKAI